MNDIEPKEKRALRRAAAVLGGQAALASLLGYADRRGVYRWFANKDIPFPAEHCPAVERATREKGETVLCEELRPDIPWGVLREQAEPTEAKAA